MKRNLTLTVSLLATCATLGHPLPAFGKGAAKPKSDSKPDSKTADAPTPTPDTKVAGDGKEYVDTGVPLHGDPTQPAATPVVPRDETKLAERALDVSKAVEEIGSEGATEVAALLTKAEGVQEDTDLGISYIVSLRINLQRFRNQGSEVARRVDEETNRLEAVILGLQTKAQAQRGQSITGQTRNK